MPEVVYVIYSVGDVRRFCRQIGVMAEQARLGQISLQEASNRYGYSVKCDVPYDGECFFAAACILSDRLPTDAKLLREELVSFLRKQVRVWRLDS